MNKKQKKLLLRIIIAIAVTSTISFLNVNGILRLLLYTVPYFVVGYDILLKALKGICNRQIFDENFLMSVATIGAFIIGGTSSGDYIEAVAVMLFYQIGELFQSYAIGKSRKNISELMNIRPDYANIEKDGKLIQCDPESVSVGDIITVLPGEKVPIDGIIIEGLSTLNTSALTGESIPRDVGIGDEISSGCINISGVLKIKTSKEFGNSTASKILELVENASSRKSKSESLVTRFARIYTPAVCIGAAVLAVVPPIISILIFKASAEWEVWIYRALTFLVASCPCALVISIPLSFFAGIGGAGKAGILVKGSNYMEALAQTKCVVFDKTGTLTQGSFEVNAVHHCSIDDGKLIEYAAMAECSSLHPIAQSIIRAYGKSIDRSRVKNIREIAGNGVITNIDNIDVAVGNDKLMKSINVEYTDCHSIGTIIHVAIDGLYAGHIVIADKLKPTSKEAIDSLKKNGINDVVMLTGDAPSVAYDVAAALNIDMVYGNLLPNDKVSKVEELLKNNRNNAKLAFVGDGINDAPVLSRADIGIAMGALGSDAAIEAADIVLMDDDPRKLAKAIRISRKCLGIVRQNAGLVIFVKLLSLILIAFGVANMWIAIFADVGVMIISVLNAVRALYVKNL